MKITFHGATKMVTGSRHLITTVHNVNILLDCGMHQGMGKLSRTLNSDLGFDASEIDYVILSHAHIDHSGLLPKMVKEGFDGKIFTSRATYDLCQIMLPDSAHIQIADANYINKKIRASQGKKFIEPLYEMEDVMTTLALFEPCELDKRIEIDENIAFTLIDNGHILGSAAVHLELLEDGKVTRLTYTGDIGRYGTQLLKDPKSFPQSDIIMCESTYGDRLHDNVENAAQDVLNAIIDTCERKQGKLIIPAFSLGRTQELVYTMNKLNLFGLLPNVKIYVDSPLSVNATEIMRKHKGLLNRDVQEFCETRPDPFGFDQVQYIKNVEDSIALNDLEEPCVIISASGMAEAGRIRHHIKKNITNPDNTILIVGYAEPRSLSGRLRKGVDEVKLFGKTYPVKAEVRVVESYSAHADYKEMLRYLSCQDASKVREMILVHGEPEAQRSWKEHLHGRGFRSIHIPGIHDTIRFL